VPDKAGKVAVRSLADHLHFICLERCGDPVAAGLGDARASGLALFHFFAHYTERELSAFREKTVRQLGASLSALRIDFRGHLRGDFRGIPQVRRDNGGIPPTIPHILRYPDIIPDIVSGFEVVKIGDGQYPDIPHLLHQGNELAAPNARAYRRLNACITQVGSGLRIEARYRLVKILAHRPVL